MEIWNILASYNTTDVSPLCHTWKACICFAVCILILFRFFFHQVISSVSLVGSDFQFFI